MKNIAPICIILWFITTHNLYSQNLEGVFQLFEIKNEYQQSKLLSDELDNIEIVQLELNSAIDEKFIFNEGQKLAIPISDTLIEIFEVRRVISYFSGIKTVLAKNGKNDLSSFIFTLSGKKLTGMILATSVTEYYDIRYDPNAGTHYLIQGRGQHSFECGIETISTNTSLDNEIIPGKDKTFHSPNMTSILNLMEHEVTIDLLIVYTKASKDWAENSEFLTIENLISQAMGITQSVFDNSDTGIIIRLVNAREIDYDEINDDIDSVTRLQRLAASPTYNPWNISPIMEDVHIARIEDGADLVAMLADLDDTGGRAFLLNNIQGTSQYGFSINDVKLIGYSYVLPHEIGHNIGSTHARNQIQEPGSSIDGLTDFSHGYRWITGGSETGYSTVMAYSEGYPRLPLFSSPEILWNGSPTGTNSNENFGPANNVHSLKLAKSVVSSYMPTKINPPVANVSDHSIRISMNQNESLSFPLSISNSGNSEAQNLQWSLDFEFISTLEKTNAKKDTGLKNFLMIDDFHDYLSISESSVGINFKLSEQSEIVFEADFEPEQGYIAGNYFAHKGWRTNSEDITFEISDANPKSGLMHFRSKKIDLIEDQFIIKSPLFGMLHFGAYTLSADISINSEDTLDTYYLFIYDHSAGFISAGVIFYSDGFLYYLDGVNESGGLEFLGGIQYKNNEYGELKVQYNPDLEKIVYYYDNQMIGEASYVLNFNNELSGKKPGFLWLWNLNSVHDAFIDMDNLKVQKVHQPFSWLDVSRFSGIIAPSESDIVNLNFSSVDVDPGTYKTDLILNSNDPVNEKITVALTLDVETSVSIDDTSIPKTTDLQQNYPNPFNPATVISFYLDQTTNVTLEVFNITGQKIATLIGGEPMHSGRHSVIFDGGSISSGIYNYRLKTDNQIITKRMTLIK